MRKIKLPTNFEGNGYVNDKQGKVTVLKLPESLGSGLNLAPAVGFAIICESQIDPKRPTLCQANDSASVL